MPAEVITLLIAVCSAAGVVFGKYIEQWVARQKTDAEVGRALRDELRADICKLQARCDKLEAEIATERARSDAEHEARAEAEALNSELAKANDELSTKCANMQRRITTLEREVADLRGAAKGRLDEPLQR